MFWNKNIFKIFGTGLGLSVQKFSKIGRITDSKCIGNIYIAYLNTYF